MAGHHRVKAASDDASRAVDLVEALSSNGAWSGAPDADGDFPFEAVADTFGPAVCDDVRLEHGKPDGRLLVLGRAEVTGRDADGSLTLRRKMTAGGTYDALGVDREAGDVAITTVREGRWWYPTVYRDADGDRKGTYVNVCTPVECFPDAVRYVDLHVDVVKGPDGEVRRVDDDELDAAVAAGQVSEVLAEKARSVAASLVEAL
jgi:Ribonuclease G/E